MANPNEKEPATGAERRIRGGTLDGSESKRSVDHDQYEERRNPDTELHLDDEKDTLYEDGLDVDDDEPDNYAGTRDKSSGIKP
jgi:hypothetical protein